MDNMRNLDHNQRRQNASGEVKVSSGLPWWWLATAGATGGAVVGTAGTAVVGTPGDSADLLDGSSTSVCGSEHKARVKCCKIGSKNRHLQCTATALFPAGFVNMS